MFSYRLVETSTDSDQVRFDPLIIHVPVLNAATLLLLPAYLHEIYAARLDLTGLDPTARPLLFDAGGGTFFSERAIWSLLVELPGAADHVVAYVSHVLSHLRGDYLPLSAPLDVVGQEPLYAYFERFIRRFELAEEGHVADHYKVVDAFLAFLQRCDMDHETFQDYYIEMILAFLFWRGDGRLTDLLHFRLTQGQFCEPRPEYAKYLAQKGTFKRIVDRRLRLEKTEGWQLRLRILEMCAIVYGNDTAFTNSVLDYCRSFADLQDASDLKSFEERLSKLRAAGQAEFDASVWRADTGFHVWNEQQRGWEWKLG